jgi:hypothetical protein
MLEKSNTVNEYTPHISETYAKYTTIDDSGVKIYDGKLSIFNTNGDAVLSADNNGNLTIRGKIEARSGYIGGWGIGSSSNSVFNGANYSKFKSALANSIFHYDRNDGTDEVGSMICLNPTPNCRVGYNDGSTMPMIVAGTVNINNNTQYPFGECNFYLSHGGYMKAKSGQIAGWNFGVDRNGRQFMYATANDKTYGMGMSTHNDYPAFWAGYDGTGTIKNKDNTKFFVQHDGALYATGATISGDITAKSGKIGGWTISDINTNKSISGEQYITVNGSRVKSKLVLSPVSEKIIDFTLGENETSNFYVHRSGYVAATDFRLIKGYIGSKNGGENGWVIGENEISIGLGNGKKVGMSASVNSNYTSRAFYAGDSFWVTHGGKLNALGANISGVFTTTTNFNNETYQLRVDGESLLFRKSSSESGIVNEDFKSGILFASNATTDNESLIERIFGSSEKTTDLAIAGDKRIVFATKSLEKDKQILWTPVCELGFETVDITIYDAALKKDVLYTDTASLYLRPSSVEFLKSARLGDKDHPWTEIYMSAMKASGTALSVIFGNTGVPFSPKTIYYTDAYGLPRSATVLAYDTITAFTDAASSFATNMWTAIKGFVEELIK